MKLRDLKPQGRELSEVEQATIGAWRKTRAGSVRLRDRACIVALSAQGWWASDIARIVPLKRDRSRRPAELEW